MLVGVTGKAGAGKDTFAKYFIDRHGFVRYGFADPLKRMLETGFDIDPGVWDDHATKEAPIPWLGRSPRYLAQTIGTDWGREMVHPDVWLLLAEQVMIKNPNLIIPDVRFDNEANWIRRHGGVVVRVTVRNDWAVDNAGHASEKGVSDAYVNHTILNDGTIEDLHKSAARVFSYALDDVAF
jgi:hypothetical protein